MGDLLSSLVLRIAELISEVSAFLELLFNSMLENVHHFFVFLVAKLIVFVVKFSIYTFEFGWAVTKEFMRQFEVSSQVVLYYSQLPPEFRSIFEFLELHTFINLIMAAYLFNLVRSFIPSISFFK